jgi:hypothetical protein
MGMVIGMAEFLENVSKLKKREEKVAALQHNDSIPLRTILQGALDPNVKWALPEGTPPYTPNTLTDQESVLIRDMRKMTYFIQGFHPNLKQIKREAMFIEMLENVAPKDALLLCSIKDKKLPYKGITIDIVKEALPGLIPDEQANV